MCRSCEQAGGGDSHWLPQDGGGEGGGDGTAGGAAAGGAACVMKVGGVTVVSALPEPAQRNSCVNFLESASVLGLYGVKNAPPFLMRPQWSMRAGRCLQVHC